MGPEHLALWQGQGVGVVCTGADGGGGGRRRLRACPADAVSPRPPAGGAETPAVPLL